MDLTVKNYQPAFSGKVKYSWRFPKKLKEQIGFKTLDDDFSAKIAKAKQGIKITTYKKGKTLEKGVLKTPDEIKVELGYYKKST